MDKKFLFFESYHKALSRVPDDCYGRVVRGMAEFVFEGAEPLFENDLDGVAWELIKPILQRGQEISKLRAEAGSKGKGISRNAGNNNAAKDKTMQNNSKSKQNKTDKDRDKDRDKDKELFLPDYIDPGFIPIMTKWIKYKKEKNEPYRETALEECYKRLLAESNNNPETAAQIIEFSISNNYSGFGFSKNGTGNNFKGDRTTAADHIFDAQREHIENLAASIASATIGQGEVLANIPND